MADEAHTIDRGADGLIWKGLQTFRRLPEWMIAARDPDRLRTSLSKAIPEFSSGELILHECDSSNVRYKKFRWSGFYELTVSSGDGSGAGTQTIHLEGVLSPPRRVVSTPPSEVPQPVGSPGWRAVVPDLNLELRTRELEAVLSSLDVLTDPERSRGYLTESIRAGSPEYGDLDIQACRPKVARYKPGSRCTIVYQLDFPADVDAARRWPELVVAKTYRNEKGRNAYRNMRAFWSSPLASSTTVDIAQPLAYDAEMNVMLQGPIREERTLKGLTVASLNAGTREALTELTAAMRKTARGLAELHTSQARLDTTHRWSDDEAEIRAAIEELSVSVPELEAAGRPFVERLHGLAASSEPDRLVPSHGTFRPAQVLMHGDRIGFIDFDSCCEAEPAKDLGLFLCAFVRAGMMTVAVDDVESDGGAIDDAERLARFGHLIEISEAFLAEYERHAMPVNRQRVALVEALELFTLVLHAWTKIKVRELDDIMFLLEHFLPAHEIVSFSR